MDWASLYPAYAVSNKEKEVAESVSHDEMKGESSKAISRLVEIADIGCGFGGLLFALAPKLPDTLLLGGPFAFGTLGEG